MTKHFRDFAQAKAAWHSDRPQFEARGVYLLDSVVGYALDEWKHDIALAIDAQPALVTVANSGIPSLFTTLVDPDIYNVLFSPTQAAEIIGEERKGTWTDQTAIFPTVEGDGEVSSYGDYNENGHSGANANWPQRQSYLFQTIAEYGELEVARAGAAKINWVSQVDGAALNVSMRFLNTSYFYGVQGLQNFGILNDPNLSAALTPSTKVAGGTKWVNSSGAIVATANEIFADIQALFYQVIQQTGGLVNQNTRMTLAMSPGSQLAMTATNSFGVNVADLLKKNFPNLRIITAVQYGGVSATNQVGFGAGNVVQLIADEVDGQKMGYGAYNDKAREFPIVRALSSWKKKIVSGTWGAIIRMPMLVATMVGV